MSLISDDVEQLISRLSGPLLPCDRAAFRRAAEDALARVPCWGEGAAYRAVASLQSSFFDPPTEDRAHWDIGQVLSQRGVSKLKDRPAIWHAGKDRHRKQHAR